MSVRTMRSLATCAQAGTELTAEAGDSRSAMLLASAVRAAAGDRDLPALSLEEATDAMRRARIRLPTEGRIALPQLRERRQLARRSN